MKRLPFCEGQHEEAKRLCALWICDPKKNKKCNKKNCGYDFESVGKCRATSKKRYALIGSDGKPVPVWRDLFEYLEIQKTLVGHIAYYLGLGISPRNIVKIKKEEMRCESKKE